MASNYEVTDLHIYKAALRDDWKSVSQMFEQNPLLMTDPITGQLETPLMIAVGTNCSHNFVRKLIDLIVVRGYADKLVKKDSYGNNALHYAAKVGNKIDAILLVRHRAAMISVQNSRGNTPLILAASHGRKDTLQYLLENNYSPPILKGSNLYTEGEGSSLYTVVGGGNLITLTIQAGFVDVALKLVAKHPDIVLGVNDDYKTALQILATKPELFHSGSRLGFLGHLIYSLIPMNKSEEASQVNIFLNVFNKFAVGFWSALEYLAPAIKNIHDIKVKHYRSKLLTKRLCKGVIEKANRDKAWKILGSATFVAVKHGTLEVIEQCILLCPYIIWYTGKGCPLSFEAITQRQERVYNLLSQISIHKVFQATMIDEKKKENSLHKAAKLAPPHRLDVVTGAALQMQRELQWFKEVENSMEPSYREALNKKKKTPRMIFIDEHKDLLKEARQWMKDTSSSCTVVAALIVTIAFAAAFTIPGGNKDDGKPLFLKNATFMLFIISDAIALFSSSTSVLMFLGILTSRYEQNDFLNTLPRRITIGLVSLFLSLAATMIAFSATLALVLQDEVTWIVVPLITLTCIPVGLFGWLQFPLLLELVYTTHGPSIFRHKKDQWIF